MNNKYLAVLKYINKHNGIVSRKKLLRKFQTYRNPDIDRVLRNLCNEGYLKRRLENDKSVYTIEFHALDVIHNAKQSKFRFAVPVIISLAAIPGAYREELLPILQALTKLLKRIVGNLGVFP